eukprot:g68951.t1
MPILPRYNAIPQGAMPALAASTTLLGRLGGAFLPSNKVEQEVGSIVSVSPLLAAKDLANTIANPTRYILRQEPLSPFRHSPNKLLDLISGVQNSPDSIEFLTNTDDVVLLAY